VAARSRQRLGQVLDQESALKFGACGFVHYRFFYYTLDFGSNVNAVIVSYTTIARNI
jgi:hypothetical protein